MYLVLEILPSHENYSSKRLRFVKSSHLPLFWQSAEVTPFRFNPRLDKENQGHPKFVQLQAKFVTGRDSFVFLEELAAPLDEAPRFLKASKLDNAEQRKKLHQQIILRKS